MGTPLALSGQCADDFDIFKDGDGGSAQSYNGTRVNLTAGAGSGRSYLRKRIPARPGEKITVKCLACANSGTPAISIDYPAQGSQKNEITFTQNEWKEYEVSYAVPYTADVSTDYVQISIGLFTADSGNVDVVLPRIEVESAINGFARVHCMGLINLVKSGGIITATINSNYSRSGIISVNYNAATPALEIVTAKSPNASYSMRPIFSTDLSTERLPDVYPRIGQYDPVTGEVLVKFGDGSGSFIDITPLLSDGDGIFLFVMAQGF